MRSGAEEAEAMALERRPSVKLGKSAADAPPAPDLHLYDFLLDCEAANLAPTTISFYELKCSAFLAFLRAQCVHSAQEITPMHIRLFLNHLALKRTAGGVHAYFRAIRAFIRFMRREEIIKHDPLRNIRAPKVDLEPLQPLDQVTLDAILATCGKDERGLRDRALLLTLYDSGMRASEALALNVGDLNLADGSILVQRSKARKSRTVFVGKQTRRALAAYLRARGNPSGDSPLWMAIRTNGETGWLAYAGLVGLIRRRAKRAGVPPPSVHSFRRGFALAMLRDGSDLVSLQRLLGHADLSILARYLKQQTNDLKQVHAAHSPVDRQQAGQCRKA